MIRPSVVDGDMLSFDIFCRVIDNYGDIGVCWRLARQLARFPFNCRTRLWVDDLERFKRLEQAIDPDQRHQTHAGVDIVHWHANVPPLTPHRVVIEAFACSPPQNFIDAMVGQDSLWLNLEYLSAEDWVDGFHLRPSIQTNGLRKYFFFPGFSPDTGGLLREPKLIEDRQRWQSSAEPGRTLLQRLGVSMDDSSAVSQGAPLVFLFCYPNAPIYALVDALATLRGPSVVLVPEGLHHPGFTQYLADSNSTSSTAGVRIRQIPFVDQDDFDRLLWTCDLNIVRGEDSLVRALWAGRPMIWQPYHQDDDVHITKLDAWLARSPLHPDTQGLIRSWTRHDLPQFQQQFPAHLEPETWGRWTTQSRLWSSDLASRTDLASALVHFCTEQL